MKCWNCGKELTEKNRKLHYPINATMFCKTNKNRIGTIGNKPIIKTLVRKVKK